ncbi:MAG: hypothetical protein H0X66_13770 [Verrucomicrobia bacterium]|nr:hypothetical protein [Verrucomicrobiota bacterium]
MKVLNPLKAPFGKGKFSPLKNVTYRQWEDAFEVAFDDGLSFLEPHKTVRKANKILPKAVITRVELDEELRHGFFVHYDNGQIAEVSWAFIREHAPQNRSRCK